MSSREVTALLTSNDFFRAFDEATLLALADQLELTHLAAGERLFRQGDPADSMYVLIQGRLGVSIRNQDGAELAVSELGPGASVGEMALLTGQARAATVYALEDADLIQFARAGFERLAEHYPQAVTEFARTVMPRLRQSQLAGILTRLFGAVDTATIRTIQAEVVWRHLASGDVLFRQGEPGDALYVVVTGRLCIAVANTEGSERPIGEVGAGEMVGEYAIFTEDVRSASAYAIRDTDLVGFPRTVFEHLIERYPQLILPLARLTIERCKKATSAATGSNPRVTAFVVVPGGPDVPLRAFAESLASALARFGPTLHLSNERFDQAYGKPGAAEVGEDHPIDVALMAWLGEQEHRYQYIVYEADTTWTPWTRRCVRQADRMLLVGNAESNPAPGDIEQEVLRRARGRAPLRMDLVILHRDKSRLPAGTRAWLAPRSVAMHHQLQWGSRADVERLARLLTGRAVGLVLGGGGARGFAHIGVIRAVHEAGIPIDLIGGASIGACIAAQYAMGLEWPALLELNRKGFIDLNPMADYTLPIVALLNAAKFGKMYRMMFGETQIEDLWLKYYCVSSNLTRGEAVVHEQGPLRKYVRASMSVPGVAPPVPDNGCLLVDGGVLNNLPADVMRRMCGGGCIIAVDVSPRVDLAASVDYGDSLSGWSAAWRQLNPLGPRLRLPTIQAILERTTSLSSVQQADLAHALVDLYMHPPIEGFGMFEVAALDRIADVGYRSAQARLAEWKQGRSF